MGKKRKTLPKEIDLLLQNGDIEELKKQFSRCEPNALHTNKFGSNIFSLSPLPREFAFWAKEQGANVNFRDHYGNPPIFRQVSSQRGDVQLLIDLGADIHVRKYDGTTPLHCAAAYGNTRSVEALLNAGAEVDARTESFKGCQSPLEMALSQHQVPFLPLLETCTLLLDHGAQIMEAARQSVSKIGEEFEWRKREIEDPEFLVQQTEALNKLYKLFQVKPAEEAVFHDGVSPICISETDFPSQFEKLWDYLVPPRGRAQTAQGEAIRIAGRVEDEILRNGGANWDSDYRKMLRVLPDYLRLGNPLPKEDIEEAERMIRLLRDSHGERRDTRTLCALVVKWVMKNPEVILPLPADYTR